MHRLLDLACLGTAAVSVYYACMPGVLTDVRRVHSVHSAVHIARQGRNNQNPIPSISRQEPVSCVDKLDLCRFEYSVDWDDNCNLCKNCSVFIPCKCDIVVVDRPIKQHKSQLFNNSNFKNHYTVSKVFLTLCKYLNILDIKIF